ncbi:MAG TPA: GAF domain-containing sensor histidine kinase [Candidatus Limnocylindrales bacterium]
MLRRRWLFVLLPIGFLAVIEALSDSILDPVLPFPRDTLLVVGVVTVVFVLGADRAFRTIDRLTDDLRQRNRDLVARTETLRSLHQVSLAVTAAGDLDAVLQTIVDSAHHLLGTEVALLVLYRADGEPRLRATSGPPDAFRPGGEERGDEITRFLHPEFARVRLATPIRSGDRTAGTLAVGARTPRSFGVDDLETLSSLAAQAAIALENSRLQERLRELAIAAERERIAREMHDGLAQVLGYVNTKSQAVEEFLAAGRVADARQQLDELALAARSVYVDVREAILGLSSPIPPDRGLVGALEEYVARFAEASKLAARVEATSAARHVALGPSAEAQVFRIVQEGLTNIRKHAGAQRVVVGLDVAGGALSMSVEDDGRGFDPDASASLGWPHFGLGAMRERASAIHGRLEWESRPGAGTTLRLRVPLGESDGTAPDGTDAATGATDAAPGGTVHA